MIITIKGTGNQYVLSENCEIDGVSYVFNSLPNSIIINNVNQGSIDKSYNLENETNTIKMTWSIYTSSFKAMFCGLSNITNIQFNYIASSIRDASYMFNGCNNLESIDFGDFDTNNMIDMHCMFAGCNKLETLDLSLFNTYKVINMDSMFKGCTSLQNLYLGESFVTSSVQNMAYMFEDCSSLISINFNNFNSPNCLYMDHMFLILYQIQ